MKTKFLPRSKENYIHPVPIVYKFDEFSARVAEKAKASYLITDEDEPDRRNSFISSRDSALTIRLFSFSLVIKRSR